MTLRELEQNYNQSADLLDSYKSNFNSLIKEIGFQQTMALYSNFCEALTEDMTIEYSGEYSLRREYKIKFTTENGRRGVDLTTIELEKCEKDPKTVKKIDFSVSNNYYDSLTNKDKFIKYSTIGKIAEIVYNNNSDLIELLNLTAEDVREEIEKVNNLINSEKEQIEKLNEQHRTLSFITFKSDLEKGIEFSNGKNFPKTQTKEIYVKKFKITHYSPSGKTMYFKYTSGWNNDSWHYNEAMVEKIEDFFNNVYGGINAHTRITDKYLILNEV